MTAEAHAALVRASTQVDFTPQLPCAFDDAFEVTAVFIDTLPGGPPQPRMNFVVSYRGQKAFVLSETRASVPFTAIPQGTHRIRMTVGNVLAEGFAGPSGTGDDSAYLRWRTGDITFELAGALHRWLTESDIRALAQGMIERRGSG